MPSAIHPIPVLRTCAFRPRRPNTIHLHPIIGVKRPACRTYADEKNPAGRMPVSSDEVGPNMQQQEHVSEEAAKTAQIMGKEGPDIEGQGTPVEEVLKDDKEAREQAPQVMKDAMTTTTTTTGEGAANSKPSTSTTTGTRRSFSTFARRRMDMHTTTPAQPPLDPSMIPTIIPSPAAAAAAAEEETPPGHKYPLPTLPLPPQTRTRHRYDPLTTQLTNLLMRDGKKATAQRNMSVILTHLRTSPAPTYTRNLLPGAPPASHLPLNPTLYLTLAIDSVAPLLRIRSQRGAAGGGMALQIPVPLGLRQRRRQAFMWILDAAAKRRSAGSGRDMFALRVAQELVAVVEGKSGVWERRGNVHRLATAARVNVGGRRR